MSEVSFFASVGTEALRYITLSFRMYHMYQSMPTHIILYSILITTPLYAYIYFHVYALITIPIYAIIASSFSWWPCALIALLYLMLPKASLPRTSPVMAELHVTFFPFHTIHGAATLLLPGVHGCLVFLWDEWTGSAASPVRSVWTTASSQGLITLYRI
jgi:hypothetical protein